MISRILIIEDNKNKLKKVKEFVQHQMPNASIHDAISYTGGIRRIYEEEWDLILLDMTLPVYDITPHDNGGDRRPTAGKEIMKRMKNKGKIVPTIIITQFDTFGENGLTIASLNEEFSYELSDIWKGTVNYVDASNKWQIELMKIITNVQE